MHNTPRDKKFSISFREYHVESSPNTVCGIYLKFSSSSGCTTQKHESALRLSMLIRLPHFYCYLKSLPEDGPHLSLPSHSTRLSPLHSLHDRLDNPRRSVALHRNRVLQHFTLALPPPAGAAGTRRYAPPLHLLSSRCIGSHIHLSFLKINIKITPP